MHDLEPTGQTPPDRSRGVRHAGYAVEPEPLGAPAVAALPSLSRQAVIARIGLVGIAAAALLASLIVILGSGAAPDGTLAAGTSDSTSANGSSNGSVDLLNGGGPFMGGRAGIGGGITITEISGSSISLKTDDGWARTVTVDSGTTYSKRGSTIALGDLKVGDEVRFRETHESDGSWTIDSLAVILPRAGGEVTKIDGSTITLQGPDGSTSTITVNGQTAYSVNGSSAELADVKVGMFLVAEGTKNSDGSLTATQVRAGDRGDGQGRGDHMGRGGFPRGPDGRQPNASASPSATSATGSAS